MKKSPMIYITACMVLCMVPSALMAVRPTTETSENRTLAALPSFKTEDGINENFLSDLGDYFNDHFAFRQELVSFDAKMMHGIFNESSTPTVVAGKDGWLFYKDSVNDYLGINVLSDRGLANLADILKQVQDYAAAKGTVFIFTVPANKNTLYAEYMPDSMVPVMPLSNMDLLPQYLERFGVNYIDLISLFREHEDILYYQKDSHWNNTGALLAYNAILDGAEKTHDSYADKTGEEKSGEEGYIGDLNSMLFPVGAETESSIDYGISEDFTWTEGDQDVTSSLVRTENDTADGTLLMYRDSFTNTLLPLMANSYADATFRKTQPFNVEIEMENIGKTDTLIIEIAERNVDKLLTAPPVVEGAVCDLDTESAAASEAKTEISFMESMNYPVYYEISGDITDVKLTRDAKIYVGITDEEGKETCFRAFNTCAIGTDGTLISDQTYKLYLKKSTFGEGDKKVTVYVENGGSLVKAGESTASSIQ